MTGYELVRGELERTQVVELGAQLRTDALNHAGHDHLLDQQRIGGTVDLAQITQTPASTLFSDLDDLLNDLVISTFVLTASDLRDHHVGHDHAAQVTQVGEAVTHLVTGNGGYVHATDAHHATVGEELGSDEDVDRDFAVDTRDLAGLDVHGALEEFLLGHRTTKAFDLGGDLIRTHRVSDVCLWRQDESVRTAQSCEVETEVHAGDFLCNVMQSSTGFVEGVFRRISEAGIHLECHFFEQGGVALEVNRFH
ncbi:hypothetical protein D3C78_165720 [compost metagenome]